MVREVAPSFGQYVQAQAHRGRPLWSGYVAQGWVAWLSWAIDALLVVAAAVAVTIPAMRVPYCNRCRSWYRTIRSGRIDVLTAQALWPNWWASRRSIIPARTRYRLSRLPGRLRPDAAANCRGRKPTAPSTSCGSGSTPATRNQVAAILDGLADGSGKTETGGS